MPTGHRLNKLGRVAAGFVVKKNERRDEIELKRKRKEAMRLSASPSKGGSISKTGDEHHHTGGAGHIDENGKPVIKSDIEL